MLSVAPKVISWPTSGSWLAVWKPLWARLVHTLALTGQYRLIIYWILLGTGLGSTSLQRRSRGDPCTSRTLSFSGKAKFPHRSAHHVRPASWLPFSHNTWVIPWPPQAGTPWVILASSSLLTCPDIWSEVKSSSRCHGNECWPTLHLMPLKCLTLIQRFTTLKSAHGKWQQVTTTQGDKRPKVQGMRPSAGGGGSRPGASQ